MELLKDMRFPKTLEQLAVFCKIKTNHRFDITGMSSDKFADSAGGHDESIGRNRLSRLSSDRKW